MGEVRLTKPGTKATTVLAIPLEEASAKVRIGDPKDDDEDMARVGRSIAFAIIPGTPINDSLLAAGIDCRITYAI